MDTLVQAANQAQAFFDEYRNALLARDAGRIADSYHCPALIAFPGHVQAVTDPAQTRTFFETAMRQYDGVTDASISITVLGFTAHSIWADVTWDYNEAASAERSVYQLLATKYGWRIGVLTPH